jgi:hypothetical protein
MSGFPDRGSERHGEGQKENAAAIMILPPRKPEPDSAEAQTGQASRRLKYVVGSLSVWRLVRHSLSCFTNRPSVKTNRTDKQNIKLFKIISFYCHEVS